MNTLRNAKITGYFSLPSKSLAEINPTAYELALRDVPQGAGWCSHCGLPIVHHVVIRDEEGKTRFIGTTCAEKVGVDPECLRFRITSEQKEWRRQAWEEKCAQAAALAAQLHHGETARIAKRLEVVGFLVDLLQSTGNDFYISLGDRLAVRPLSDRQAWFAVKVISETGRRNKANAEAWDSALWLLTAKDEELAEYASTQR